MAQMDHYLKAKPSHLSHRPCLILKATCFDLTDYASSNNGEPSQLGFTIAMI